MTSGASLALASLALGLFAIGCRAEPPPGDEPAPSQIMLEVAVPGAPLPKPVANAKRSRAKAQERAASRTPSTNPSQAGALAEPKQPASAETPPVRASAAGSPDQEAPKSTARVADAAQAAPGARRDRGRSSLLLASFSPQQVQAPVLLDADSQLLPQTEERPGVDSDFFRQLGPTLFEAIVKNDPERMLPYFMPLAVYEKLKDSKNPARDWKFRLYAQLKRDVERYHRRLGRNRTEAKFLALDVTPQDALWMKVGREYNKLEYYRLFGSRLRYRDARGRERSLNVSALFSWRGEWYVVHLDGLK